MIRLVSLIACCLFLMPTAHLYGDEGEESYIIGPTDLLLITVVGHEELTTLEAVRSDGKISFPKVGQVQASGLTAYQLSQNIRESLRNYYTDPQVTVIIKEFKRDLIYVLGEVVNPGEIRIAAPVNLLEAIAKAGGYKPATANLEEAKLVKNLGSSVQNIDLKKLLEQDILENNSISDELLSLKLSSGDLIIIPSAIKKEEVNIIGNVRNPGRFPVKSSLKTFEALALAGGAVPENADLTRVKILKPNGDQISVDLTKSWEKPENDRRISSKLETVEPGDTMVVLGKNKVNVIGHVRNPGQYPIDSDISVFEALALAGGPLEESGDLTRIKVIKVNGENSVIDLTEAWKEGKDEEKFRVSSGDTIIVPKALKVNWYLLYTIVLVLISIQSAIRSR